jgi:hypothetical protein
MRGGLSPKLGNIKESKMTSNAVSDNSERIVSGKDIFGAPFSERAHLLFLDQSEFSFSLFRPVAEQQPIRDAPHAPEVDRPIPELLHSGSTPEPSVEIVVNAHERRFDDAQREAKEVPTPAELETPRLSEANCTDQAQDSTPVEPIPVDPNDMTGLRKLAAAVLVRAVEDAKHDSRARRWFEVTPQPMLAFWCEVAGLNCERVRMRAREMAAAG